MESWFEALPLEEEGSGTLLTEAHNVPATLPRQGASDSVAGMRMNSATSTQNSHILSTGDITPSEIFRGMKSDSSPRVQRVIDSLFERDVYYEAYFPVWRRTSSPQPSRDPISRLG